MKINLLYLMRFLYKKIKTHFSILILKYSK